MSLMSFVAWLSRMTLVVTYKKNTPTNVTFFDYNTNVQKSIYKLYHR